MKVNIVYGSETGNTRQAAKKIAAEFSADEVALHNIAHKDLAEITDCDLLILGCSTWGVGELGGDWEGVVGDLASLQLDGKKVAIFGLGDQASYPDSFVDAMGIICEELRDTGASFIGLWPTEGYDFDASKGISGNNFLGLVLDEENQDDLSDQRIAEWCQQLKKEG